MKFRTGPRTTKTAIRGTALGALLVVFALPLLTGAPATPRNSLPDFEPADDRVGWNNLPLRIRHVRTGMILVLIEPGTAQLGSLDSELDRDQDEVSREARISRPFYLGETEVTIAEWRATGSALPVENAFDESEALPVQGVSWYRAKELVTALEEMGSNGWRLPSEDEWEYACRAGTRNAFSFSGALSPQLATYNARWPYGDAAKAPAATMPTRVRSHAPNAWGLYDMHGNVWEWCEDLYLVDPRTAVVTTGGLGADVKVGASRVLRGGAWTSRGSKLRSASRDGYSPNSTGSEYGVRMVFEVPPEWY